MRKTTPLMAAMCLAGVLLNILINRLSILANLPLYMDTVGTVAVTLTCGVFWGSLSGALYNLINHTLIFWGWEGYLYALCNIATAVTTWLFIRFFPAELDLHAKPGNLNYPPGTNPQIAKPTKIINCTIVLLLLSLALCLVMSVSGGLITTLILVINPSLAEQWGVSARLSASLFQHYYPILLVEITSRIPINMIDRLIASYGGFGVALLVRNAIVPGTEFPLCP